MISGYRCDSVPKQDISRLGSSAKDLQMKKNGAVWWPSRAVFPPKKIILLVHCYL